VEKPRRSCDLYAAATGEHPRHANGALRYIGGIQLNTTFITGDLELLGEAIVDAGNPLSKAGALVVSWIGYASGGLLDALSALELPHHSFLLPMVLALMSLLAVTLMPAQVNS
jgi:uncharacterized membrane protein YoaK (UPF0700 family)